MNNKLITPIIIVIILIGAYFLLSKKPDSFENNQINLSQSSSSNSQNNNQLPINSTSSSTMNQLKIEDIKIGTGAAVKSGDTVIMHYLGTLQDGTKFDSSYDRGQPFETKIGVGQVIEGWDQGVPGMKVGGKRRLTIPSDMAYGDNGIPGAIPPKATLIFEVELMGIK